MILLQKVILTALCWLLLQPTSWAQSPTFMPETIKGREGYFRVGQTTAGQWWFITPDNKPFYYKGICAVNRAGNQGGRRATPGAYAATIDAKYNYQQSPDAFVQATLGTMRSQGFNALGAWATEEFFNVGMPFTEIIEYFKEGPFLPTATGKEGLPDIFDPAWLIGAERKTRALCTPLRYSKDLVGYFTDNEIGFGKVDDSGFDLGFQAGQFDVALLRMVLGMDTAKAAHKAAWAFLLQRYQNSFEKLSKAWGVLVQDVLSVKKLNEQKLPVKSEAYEKDAADFSKFYAERYFEITHTLIKRYDPNHLILGCRFGAPPPYYVLNAIKPFTDVISANNYQPVLYDRYDTVYKHTGLPLLIGEVSWNTDLFKRLPYADETAKPHTLKERMFRAGSNTITRTAWHDGIVGFTWYRWVQGVSTEERFFDGVVNYNDELDVHTAAHKALVPGLDEQRLKANGGAWKNAPLKQGEMNLFFDSLRTNWNHFLRLEFKDGKPLPHVAGWKMNGMSTAYTLKNNVMQMTLEVDFEESPSKAGVVPAGKGIYQIQLQREGEKWRGTYKGMYNGKPISGKMYAFYFPTEL